MPNFDDGFSSKENISSLEKIILNVMIKQKGKPNKERMAIGQGPDFKKINNAHQAIASNINQLEYHGLYKCRDKGEENFKKHRAMAVVSYNLHRLGNLIKKQLTTGQTKIKRKTT